MIPYGMMPSMIEEDEAKPEKPSGRVFACIMRKDGNTFCHRQPSSKEFTFSREGAERVIDFYDPRTMKVTKDRLTGCIACIDEAKALIEREKKGMANR